MKKKRRTTKAAKARRVPLRGFRGGDPVAIGRLGGLQKAANAKKESVAVAPLPI